MFLCFNNLLKNSRLVQTGALLKPFYSCLFCGAGGGGLVGVDIGVNIRVDIDIAGWRGLLLGLERFVIFPHLGHVDHGAGGDESLAVFGDVNRFFNRSAVFGDDQSDFVQAVFFRGRIALGRNRAQLGAVNFIDKSHEI